MVTLIEFRSLKAGRSKVRSLRRSTMSRGRVIAEKPDPQTGEVPPVGRTRRYRGRELQEYDWRDGVKERLDRS